MTIQQGLYAPLLDEGIANNVRANALRHRAVAVPVEPASGLAPDGLPSLSQLAAEHEAHVAELAAIEARFDAWSKRIDALCEEWSKHNA